MCGRTISVLARTPVLALGGQAAPALAATTTWTVANPNADQLSPARYPAC
ncbi:hypothetical protein [Actinocorallia libanotica]|uniref:Uncharacterized protein n=1 Tax=Actinocorallia libanotica TaxID=46162 RepID=A0ABP4C9L1_9ACTN